MMLRMRTIMKYIPFLLSSLLIGCSATGPLFREVDVERQDQSIIYVYRIDTGTLAGRKACFSLDGERLAELKNNGYTYFMTSPGTHKIRFHWEKKAFDSPSFQKILEIDVLAPPGGAAYVELYPSSVFESSFRGSVSETRWILRQAPALYGERAIQECRYQENPTRNIR